MKISSLTVTQVKNTTKLCTVTLSTSLFSSTHRFLVNVSAPFQVLRWRGWGRSHQGTHEHVKVQRNWESRVCVCISTCDPLQLRNPQPYIVALGWTHSPDISACNDIRNHQRLTLLSESRPCLIMLNFLFSPGSFPRPALYSRLP